MSHHKKDIILSSEHVHYLLYFLWWGVIISWSTAMWNILEDPTVVIMIRNLKKWWYNCSQSSMWSMVVRSWTMWWWHNAQVPSYTRSAVSTRRFWCTTTFIQNNIKFICKCMQSRYVIYFMLMDCGHLYLYLDFGSWQKILLLY